MHTALLFGATGLFLTLLYDVLTNLSIAWVLTDSSTNKIVGVFIAGMGFAVLHIVTNTLSFALVVLFLMRDW